ncbi:MAG: hypothetical protein AB6733_12145 [Clostridiaceae bacterium]
MNFKEILENDLNNVFFNSSEFAEEHNIHGRLLNIVLDNEHLMKRSKVEYEGVTVGDILYFVNAKEYGKPPKIGEVQNFDNIPCVVFDIRIDSGVYEVILKKNVS